MARNCCGDRSPDIPTEEDVMPGRLFLAPSRPPRPAMGGSGKPP